jgi:hypothetical protein
LRSLWPGCVGAAVADGGGLVLVVKLLLLMGLYTAVA